MTMYPSISSLLAEGKSFINMYEAFGDFRTGEDSAEHREIVAKQLEEKKGSLFASHPTFRERVEAVAAWPNASHVDDSPAMNLFEDGLALEHELTEFMTAVVALAQQQAEADAAAASQ